MRRAVFPECVMDTPEPVVVAPNPLLYSEHAFEATPGARIPIRRARHSACRVSIPPPVE